MVPPRVNIYFRFFLRVPCRLSEVLRALRFWFYGKYWLPKAANLNVILEIRFWIYGKYRNPKAAICDCENLDGFWDYEKYRNPKGDCGQTAAEAFWDYGKYRKTKGKIFMQKLDCGSERTFFERKGELEDNIWR